MSERNYWANRYGLPVGSIDNAGMERARRFQAEVAGAFSKQPKSEEEAKQPNNKNERTS